MAHTVTLNFSNCTFNGAEMREVVTKADQPWVAAPSSEDADNYGPYVGRRGSSAALAALSEAERAAALAPVAHEVLITSYRAMKDGDPRKPN